MGFNSGFKGLMKNANDSVGNGTRDFWLVTVHLKQLRHPVPSSVLLCVKIYGMCGLVVLAKLRTNLNSPNAPPPQQLLKLMAETLNGELNVYLHLAGRFMSVVFPAGVYCNRVLIEHSKLISVGYILTTIPLNKINRNFSLYFQPRK